MYKVYFMINSYDMLVFQELTTWQKKMLRSPSLLNKFSKKMQTKFNSWIPEKVHRAITVTIKQMVRSILFGAKIMENVLSYKLRTAVLL